MTAERLRARGISRQLIRALIRSGDLVQMRRGAYATKSAVEWAGTDVTRCHVLRVQATVVSVGKRAVASHQSAAILHHLDLLKSPPANVVTLTLPPDKPWNRARHADVVFHAAELTEENITKLHNVRVTTAARTVIDLARTLPFTDAVVVADSALQKEKTTNAEQKRIQ